MPLHSSWVWIKGGRRGKVTAGQGWRRRYDNRNNRVSCHRWQAKVIKLRKACVHSWFKPSCRLCLVFCSFLMPTALLIEWPPLLSALRENPISGMITVPSYCCCCADQCSDEVSGPRAEGWGSELLPPPVLSDRVSNPYRSSPADNLRSDKARLCVFDPAHCVLSFCRCVEKVGMDQDQEMTGWLTGQSFWRPASCLTAEWA